MAKKARKRPAKKEPQPTPMLTAKIAFKDVKDIPSYYIDNIEVSMGMHDFALTVGKLPSRFSAEDLRAATETNVVFVEPILQLFVPPTLFPGLIRALTIQKDAYEKLRGEIRDPSAPPPESPTE